MLLALLRRLAGLVKAKWLVTLIGALVICALIWFVGPLIAIGTQRPLEDAVIRVIAIIVVLLIWALMNLSVGIRESQANKRMIGDLAKPSDEDAQADAAASAEEVGILRRRMLEALALLRQSRLGGRGGRRYLYQLPWYIIIGPPGSGKTTALVNSGLNFPLADKLGGQTVRGIGGTRNCDWMFTDDAVLIDTAGRYTTQDSHQPVDSAAWTGFLDLLKKYRPRQPINGALVTISLADLVMLDPEERDAHARAIRQRIRELRERLGVRFPIYVIFTKADLIAGFVEFYDDLGRDDREQVWGMTFPVDEGQLEGGAVAAFDAEFDLLMERLGERLLLRIHQEPDVQRRSLIFGFPQQVASLKETAREFLTQIFRPNTYEARPFLRGVYFTSGTQDGAPIDRLMSAMASTFGLDRQSMPAFRGRGRTYFLTRLLRQVIFAEANIVGFDRRVERRRRWLWRSAVIGAVLLAAGMGSLWYLSYRANQQRIAEVETQLARYQEMVDGLDMASVSDTDFARILGPIVTLRRLPHGYDQRDAEVPFIEGLGLYQGRKIGTQAVAAYEDSLEVLMLPRLILRVEQQIRGNQHRLDYLYQALKVYLMLGGQGPLDPALIEQWMMLDWNNVYPGESNRAGRQALADALRVLLQRLPDAEVELDATLIEETRRTLAQFPLAARAYTMLLQRPEIAGLPDWRVVDHAGPAAARAFYRLSGQPLSEGVDGAYTYNAFYNQVVPAVDQVARTVAAESWVLGGGQVVTDEAGIDQLKRDLLSLYYADYSAAWDALLADVRVVPFQNLTHAVGVLNVLSGPNSPLRAFLTAVARETTLTVPPAPPPAPAAEPAEGGAAAEPAPPAVPDLARIVQAATGAPAGELPGQPVDERFRELHAFVRGADGQPPPLEAVIAELNGLYMQLNRASSAPAQGAALLSALTNGPDGAGTLTLQSLATRLPPAVGEMIAAVAQGSSDITVGGARERINGIWTTTILPFCRSAIDNRYPIFASGTSDVTLADFSRLFAPDGLIDGFFKENLQPFVDTSQEPWRWQQVENSDLGIPDAVLVQFERAAKIRDAFFPAGPTPSIPFELVPLSLDARATQALVEMNGQSLTYSHGPQLPVAFTWPGNGGPQQSRVSFQPPLPGQPSSISIDGPWSWFRLMDRAYVEGAPSDDRFRLTFVIGERSATFELRANSVVSPFTLRELEEFRCPPSL